MDRSLIYSLEQIRSFDFAHQPRDMLKGLSHLARMLLGINTDLLSGFSAAQQPTPDLSFQLADGQIYQWRQVDESAFGPLPADTQYIWQQGYSVSQTISLSTAQLAAGQSQWVLIQCKFTPSDEVRSGDPTGGLLPYYNSVNPLSPLQGPGGNGAVQPSVRNHKADVSVVYGTPATTGAEVPPTPGANNVAMYLVKLTFGQLQITTGQILKAGAAAYSGYAYEAPFFGGMLQKHHKGGEFGQAPPIDLTDEVQGILGLAHLPASNTVGILPTWRKGNLDPNGNVAGNVDDLYFKQDTSEIWVCITTGDAANAVWVGLGAADVTLVSAFPLNLSAKTIGNFLLSLSSADGIVNLPTADKRRKLSLKRVDSTQYAAKPTVAGSDKIVVNGVEKSSFDMLADDAFDLVTPGNGKWYLM